LRNLLAHPDRSSNPFLPSVPCLQNRFAPCRGRGGGYSFELPYLLSPNRKNAQKCTGPRTEAGKEKSSQNALKTGLDAKSEVLRFESRPDYEALIAAFYDRYQPTVPEDRALVDMLIRSEWLLRRYTAIDTAIWEHEFFKGETSLGATFLKSQEAFERVGRRINWAQRNYQIALKQLLDTRAKRAHADEAAEPESAVVREIDQEIAPEPPAPDRETEPLNSKLVSFLPRTPQSAVITENQPEKPENTPAAHPKPEENPPTAV